MLRLSAMYILVHVKRAFSDFTIYLQNVNEPICDCELIDDGMNPPFSFFGAF